MGTDVDVTGLRADVEGEVVAPSDPGYEDARKIWNGVIDTRPAVIVRCSGVPDVVTAVGFARANELPIAVRGGGHNVAGTASVDDGLVVDLSSMRTVEVDPEQRTVRVAGGATLGDVDGATQAHGLATPVGVVSETGIAGLTLSGGIGWLRRKHGMSCDNLLSAQVVTTDGRVLTTSEDEHPDLFWGYEAAAATSGS